MPDASPCRKKKKLTITATEKGVETAERALIRLGFDSKSNFAKSQLLSRSTVTNFFNQVPIQPDSFKRICEALKLKWQEIAGITQESIINHEPIKIQVNAMPDIIEEGVKQKMLVPQVAVIDKDSQNNKILIITLQGDMNSINSISDRQRFEAMLKKHGVPTIQVTDIQEGSIKLIIEGSEEDIERLLIQIKSGELTELDGFPVEDVQILSESSEDGESSEEKWRLVEEIVTNQIIGRDLNGADLSDADLSGACLIDANLNEADLSDSDLNSANLRGANLRGANLSGTDLSDTNLSDTNLSGTDLSDANLSSTILGRFNLREALQRGALQRDARALQRIALLGGANMRDALLSGANLSGVNLSVANLSGANLRSANLSGADLILADLSGADLSDANLSGTDLRLANLSGANLIDADLSGIQVERTRFLDNLGITEEQKKDLIKRGAIFEDSPGNPAGILTRV
ncbi:pentapeptide repeat-containing protein [Microcoleus sp. A2-C5]|uniref:pentapeptide repeat-containing protein n=1 Tax=unclassified Microcoleus TaxID=2642155 RepID=UPI002FD2410A